MKGENTGVYIEFGDISSLEIYCGLGICKEDYYCSTWHCEVWGIEHKNEWTKKVAPQRHVKHEWEHDGSHWSRNGKVEGIPGETASKPAVNMMTLHFLEAKPFQIE